MDRLSPEGALREHAGPGASFDEPLGLDCRPAAVGFPQARMRAPGESGADGDWLLGSRDRDTMPSPEERLARLVRTIEADIIPRLVRAHRQPETATPPAATRAGAGWTMRGQRLDAVQPSLDVRAFAAFVLTADDASLFGRIDRLVADGVAVESMYVDLLGPTARHLGQMWADDRCNFADVTIAAGRLQQILRRLSPAFGASVEPPADGRRILLLPGAGEQHTLGLAMVADYFSRAGWVVTASGSLVSEPCAPACEAPTSRRHATDPQAVRTVRREWFDVIGLSLGSARGLEALKAEIAALRRASRNRAVGILVGGPLFVDHPEQVRLVGADATAVEGRDAPSAAEGLLAQRMARLG
jgi:MerR family transcriptional regulator, light-induced transcriptional regulator